MKPIEVESGMQEIMGLMMNGQPAVNEDGAAASGDKKKIDVAGAVKYAMGDGPRSKYGTEDVGEPCKCGQPATRLVWSKNRLKDKRYDGKWACDKCADNEIEAGTAKESKTVVVGDTAFNRLHVPQSIGQVLESTEATRGVELQPVFENDDDEDMEHEDHVGHECPSCGGPGGELGSLGSTKWCRCRDCGMDFRANESVAQRRRMVMEMAQNTDVADMFVKDSFPKDKKTSGGTKNLKITKADNGWMLVNYTTPILYRRNGSNTVYFNTQKYSVTTSKIQGQIGKLLAQSGVEVVKVDEPGIKKAIEGTRGTGSTEDPVIVERQIKDAGDEGSDDVDGERKVTGAYGVEKKAKPVTGE